MSSDPLTLLHSDPASRPAREVLEYLGVSRETGLEEEEARRRLQRYGPNLLRSRARRGWPVILLDQLGPAAALLAGAAVLSAGLGGQAGSVAFAVALLLRTAVGFVTDLVAERSMESFRRLGRKTARVRRGGEVREIPAEELVPGDVVSIGAGERISADLRLLAATDLRTDESGLTGAPGPVAKDLEPKWPGAPLAERTSMVFSGTEVTRGAGEGVVVATGAATELGRVSTSEEDDTSFEGARLPTRFGRRLARGALLLAALVAALAVALGQGTLLAAQLAVAVFVAVVPENLTSVASLSLARGVLRMTRDGIVVNRPVAVEKLASTGLLWTDEAGVLTEGRMTAVRVWLEGGEAPVGERLGQSAEDRILREMLEIGVLCSAASPEDGEPDADPAGIALIEAADAAGLDRESLVRSAPRARTVLSPGSGATYHRVGEGVYLVAVKGLPATVLEGCTRVRTARGEEFMRGSEREWWEERNERLAEDGLRVLALAAREAASEDEEPYEDLTLLGLVGFEDPIREDTPAAVRRCRELGVRVVAASHDQTETVRSIARDAGLAEDAADIVSGEDLGSPEDADEEGWRRVSGAGVFAGLSPEQVERVISGYSRDTAVAAAVAGREIAALRAADTGIAVGRLGHRAARRAADFILEDAAFSKVVEALERARGVFANVKRYSTYRLSCGVAVVLVATLALLTGHAAPALPLLVLLLGLLTHVYPALALAVGTEDPGANEPAPVSWMGPVRTGWPEVSGYAVLLAGAALAAFGVASSWNGVPGDQAATVSFLTLGFAQLWHALSVGAPRAGALSVSRNPYVWAALALCAAALALAVYVPGLAAALGLEPIGPAGWAVALGLSPLPLLLGGLYRRMGRTS